MLAVAVVFLLAVFAAPAHAAPPSASAVIADPVGDEAPTDATRVEVSWAQGRLAVAVTYAVPPSRRSLDLLVSSRSLNEDDADVDDCDPDQPESLEVRDSGDGVGTLTLPDGDPLEAPAQLDPLGLSVRYEFASPDLSEALAPGDDGIDPFTCVSGDAYGDTFYGGFTGKTLKLNPATALAALRVELTRRYGTKFSSAAKPWLECPKEELLPAVDPDADYEGNPVRAICEFEFKESSKRYRGGAATVELQSGVPSWSYFGSTTYTKESGSCRIASSKRFANRVRLTGRRLRATDSLGRPCSWLVGGAGMARDIESAVTSRYPRRMPSRYVVGLHGTNRAGFETQALFPCRVSRRASRYTFRCRNQLGDGFVYSFAVTRQAAPKPKPKPKPKPAPKPRAPQRSCDPNYAGACLNPNASDYDCRGGGGNGPSYTGRVRVVGDDHYDLDSNGDGVGCEDS